VIVLGFSANCLAAWLEGPSGAHIYAVSRTDTLAW